MNSPKCCFPACSARGNMRFKSGERMKCVHETTYLGASVAKRVDPDRKSEDESLLQWPFKKLDIFWLKTNCNKKRKLLVYNAVITSKLVYGLETLEPTASAEKILNTFQLKGERKILQLHTTFNTRSNTNEYVYNRANEVTNAPSVGIHRKIKPLTEVLGERRLKLLGHVLRRDRQHPLHQAAFKTQSAVPRETEQRRVGRPRQFWTTANMEKAWNIITSKDVSVPKVPFNNTTEQYERR